ncbi:phage tail protein [Pseudacidovorax intermedius]|uniref:phage tail protein n=1 Tax=Pseudacidovorax intermedius TaxID=433924 RepID=UPI0026E989EC|nr:phage tail protein [Pseudacidovorax intermedius]
MGQALGIVGAAVGYYFGGPTGAQWGYAIGSAVGGMVDPTVVRGPSIGEVAAQTSAEGSPRSIIYGVAACYGNVIACGPALKTWEMGEQQGKGGGAKTEQEAIYRSYVIRICEGPIGAILRVWQDDKLVYDVRGGSLMLAESAQWIANKAVYLGTEDQVPDVFSVINISGPDTPAYRGTAYMVVGLEDLTDRRGSLPQYRFEVAVSASEYMVTLPKIGTLLVTGGTTGGSFVSGAYFEDPSKGLGNVWLADVMLSNGDALPVTVQIYVEVRGARLFSRPLTVPADGNVRQLAQINVAAPVGTPIRVGFEGAMAGSAIMYVRGLNASQSYEPALEEGEPFVPVLLPEHPRFGVIKDDEGNLGTAWLPSAPWGPEEIAMGYIGGPASLAAIVSDLHARCDVGADVVDVSELTDEVQGVVLAGEYTAAAAIDALRAPYKFDRSEHDGKLWYPKRGKPVVATLTLDDLVDVPDVQRREQAIEYPAKHHLFFQHADSGYAVLKATSMRSSPDVRVVGEASVQVPVVLSSDEAARITSMLHKVAWAEADGEVKLSIPESWLWLVASNCIGLSLRGQVSRLRIDQVDDAGGVRALTLRHDRQSAYTSAVSGIPIPAPTLPPSTIVGSTELAVLDIPARIDSEDDLSYLVSGAGASGGWYGWVLQRSLDAGATYSQALSSTTPGVLGALVDALPAASEHYTDTTNTVRVQLLRRSQVLEDLTDQQFLAEEGAFALQNADGSWEVLQYRDATDEGGGVFALRTLHRGRLNTGASAHAAGARFVLLERAQHITAQSAWLGQTLTHRAPSQGQAAELAAVQSMVFVGRSQREWPVVDLRGAVAAGVLTLEWAARHRFGTDDAPVASINFLGFRVTVTDGTTTRVSETAAPSVAVDVGDMAGALTAQVVALNRITGAGPVTSITL